MRPWTTWTIFGLFLAIGLGIMGWLSATTLRLDDDRRLHQHEEDTLRQACQIMETSIQVLLARENARPYLTYRRDPTSYPQLKRFGDSCPWPWSSPDEKLPPEIRLLFEVDTDGHLTSPQVVEPAEQAFNEFAHVENLTRLKTLVGVDPSLLSDICDQTPAAALVNAFWDANPGPDPAQQMAQTAFQKTLMLNAVPVIENVKQTVVQGAWVEGELILARRMEISNPTGATETYFQGSLLDWPAIQTGMLEDISELLPEADLQPFVGDSVADAHLRLYGLPLRLVPGRFPEPPAMAMTAIEGTVVLAWVCLLLAALAVAYVLRGVLALSERRGAFVSAVTHELRTPLTTFRMYSEMLAEDMVGPDKRQRYLERLRTEADRLGHLVENVLTYARLDRGRGPSQLQELRLVDIYENARERLLQRTEQAGMGLEFEANGAAELAVRTDLAATEQVLFNLVDNACKYALETGDRRIHIEALRRPGAAGLRVRDHGPGISREARRRLFTPFAKSDVDAANSAPGVGLGLSLCRRLARDLGGDLFYEPTDNGAAFVLQLPLSR